MNLRCNVVDVLYFLHVVLAETRAALLIADDDNDVDVDDFNEDLEWVIAARPMEVKNSESLDDADV